MAAFINWVDQLPHVSCIPEHWLPSGAGVLALPGSTSNLLALRRVAQVDRQLAFGLWISANLQANDNLNPFQ
jgi:hypothetical protein